MFRIFFAFPEERQKEIIFREKIIMARPAVILAKAGIYFVCHSKACLPGRSLVRRLDRGIKYFNTSFSHMGMGISFFHPERLKIKIQMIL